MARHGSLNVQDYPCPHAPAGTNHELVNAMSDDDLWVETSCRHCGWSWADLDALVRHASGFNRIKRKEAS